MEGCGHCPLLVSAHHAIWSCTYSKSPGLLSMPTFGGAIQPANLPGSHSGFISDWMKSPSAVVGSHSSLLAVPFLAGDHLAIRGDAGLGE